MRISHVIVLPLACLMAAVVPGVPSETLPAPATQRPHETREVDGTDSIYVSRHGFIPAMFVVTLEGIIATDPMG